MEKIQLDYTLEILKNILAIDSPSGYCHHVLAYLEQEVKSLGYAFEYTQKGGGLISVPGATSETGNQISAKALGLGAHVDTLGAMVRSIKSNGYIRFTAIGGYMMNTVEGEYVRIHTREGKVFTGTVLSTKPSVHVYSEARDLPRKEENMEIRLDLDALTKEAVQAVGIQVGDYIAFDPRTVFTESGYIKSRHLDDKAGIAIIMGLLAHLSRHQITPKQPLKILFSNYEEVGHGSAFIPNEIEAFLAIDMGAMGEDLECTEKDVSICVKDSSGPYDYGMVTELIERAKKHEIRHTLDVYPFYASDVSAALSAGHNIKGALIGPGVHASHGIERTHRDSLQGALTLIIAYVTENIS